MIVSRFMNLQAKIQDLVKVNSSKEINIKPQKAENSSPLT